jgi:glycerol-1-phosphate dehydrogenase [NAD(P)+]
MEEATEAILESAEGIAAGEVAAFEKLTYGLVLSGIAMQMMGNSRPASGGEHHISHCIEMGLDRWNIHSDALHGEKVGVGTLLAADEYHRLAGLPAEAWGDYPGISEEEILNVFGERLAQQVQDENRNDCAAGITGEQIRSAWEEVRTEIGKIPTCETLLRAYQTIGAMTELSDLGVAEEAAQVLLNVSPMVRNRLTLMRLRRCLNQR